MTERQAGGLSLWKTGTVAVLLLLLVVVVVQNIEPLPVHFLFFEFSLPGAILVFVPFLLGVVVAMITAARKARS
ncbi:LapA family protein [Candidatus Fermentibacteria bacterium]|nr:LapA family protein [Candidatus Fermentibacteria bacterium]